MTLEDILESLDEPYLGAATLHKSNMSETGLLIRRFVHTLAYTQLYHLGSNP